LPTKFCCGPQAIIPLPSIVAFRWVGVALWDHSLAGLGHPAVRGFWISSSRPLTREGAMLDSIWLLFGWIGGLLLLLPIFGLRELVAYVWA
jgi:hypothetical protein